jgi:hypothetical protein
VEAFAKLGRDLVELVAFVDLDGLAGGVENDAAVLAAIGVSLYFLAKIGGEVLVEVVG